MQQQHQHHQKMATPNRSERNSAPAAGTGNDCDNGTIAQSANISASAGATPRNSGSSTASSNCAISSSNATGSPVPAGNATNTTAAGQGSTSAGSTPVAENGDGKSAAVTPGAPGSSGHKGSIRGNKLARRARSFKDDFLEKISQIRTPTNTMTR